MSKIVDKFKQLSRGAAPSLGFRPAPSLSQSPQMLLIASLAEMSAEAPKILVDSGIDAVLLRGGSLEAKSLKEGVAALGDIPLGVSLGESSSEAIAKIVDSGCDFVVFNSEAPAGILGKEGLGKILEVKPTLDPGLVRVIDDLPLPVDGVLIAGEGEKPFITVEQLLVCQRFAELLDKPLLVTLPSSVSGDQLRSLWEVGVYGVVVSEGQWEVFSELKKAIGNLPRGRIRRATKTVPVLPKGVGEIGVEVEEEEEEI